MLFRYFMSGLLLFICVGPVSAEKVKKYVLLLHSYNQGLKWTDDLNKSIYTTILSDSSFLVDLHIEYMDTKHFPSGEYLEKYKIFFLAKYRSKPLDLIITTDNDAFRFLSENRDSLLKKPPVVFCGLNNVDTIHQGFTGILEDIDVFSNLQSILTIHPDYKKLYIIVDRSVTGEAIREKSRKVISSRFPQLKHEYLTDLTLQELQARLSTLKKGDIVLLLIFNTDRSGMTISYDHILDHLKPVCKVPIYGVWDFYLNKGIVGGKITSASVHGRSAAEIALRILKGANPASIPVKVGPSEYYYDNNVLKEFKIKKSRIPQKSIILNTPVTFIKEHLLVIVFISVLFILMLIIILELIKLFSKEKHIRKKEQIFVQELRKKSIELEKALQQAESSSQLKSAFLSNLSHEIRTPLNAIVGFSDLLVSHNHDKKQEEYVSIIRSSSGQLLSIISDILELSIIDTEQVTLHFTRFDVNKVIEEICSSCEVTLHQSSKVVTRKILPFTGRDAVIISDEVKLRQIISYLLTNAYKFTDKGFVEIGYRLNNGYLEFYVKDSGIGIDPKYHQAIFERFRKVGTSEMTQFRGLGIGLTLAQAFVKLLGGNIWLESDPGVGSTFYFTLPYKKNDFISEVQSVTGGVDFKNFTILLCEDDEHNQLYFRELFHNTNANILFARNGIEAVNICIEHPSVDLVLMDLKMPEMNGWDATKIIKKNRPELPVIAQTAYALSSENLQFSQQGFDDYITKPIKKAELFEKIAYFLVSDKKQILK